MATPDDEIVRDVNSVLALQHALDQDTAEIQQNEVFRNFLEAQKQTTEKIADTWKMIEQKMIDNNVKSLKGEFGSITIAERTTFETNDQLPDEYYKKVPDAVKIGKTYKLEGEPPVGATAKVTKYLMKRIK